MTNGYWANTLKRRISRRRMLAASAGATSLFAMALSGCGDDEGDSQPGSGSSTGGGATGATGATGSTGAASGGSGGSTGAASSSLVAEPVDTTAQAVRGGTMLSRLTNEGPHFDPTTGGVATYVHTAHSYSRLTRYKLGTVFDPPDGSVEPDVASSWEFSGDGMELTFKLQPGIKLDARAPTSGRDLNIDDVKYTFDRYQELSPDGGNYFTSVSPDAPIDSVEFPDSSTIVFKLAYPSGGVVKRFAGSFFIVPVEADNGFDMRQEMRGTGPWMLTEYTPSVGWKYERNPNWHADSKRPFLDGVEYTLMPEISNALAQFKAGRLWELVPPAEEVLLLKDENPNSQLMAVHPMNSGLSGGYALALSKLDGSPIQKDVRVRQAISHLIDRDGWIDTFFNVNQLASEGLPMESAWNSHLSCTCAEWLDPKTDALGEGAKYFQFDPEEAAALLNAAGQFGMETEFAYGTSSLNRPESVRWMEVLAEMLQAGGHFKLDVKTGDYIQWYRPTYFRVGAQWEGIAWVPGATSGTDIENSLFGFWQPGGRDDAIGDYSRVPGLEDLLMRYRSELDNQKRIEIAHEFQREMALQMPVVLFPGLATSFTVYQPFMGNAGLHRTHALIGEYVPDKLTDIWFDEA